MYLKHYWRKKLQACFFVLALLSPLQAQFNTPSRKAPYNKIVLESINSMPLGGGYSTSSLAMQHLREAVTLHDGKLNVIASHAIPSFCSEATYLVFLKTITLLQERKQLTLEPTTAATLLPQDQSDGEGIWGRWNANGPGVARLFYELHLGSNFTNLTAAEPGDFLKIFWSDAIGASEHGHLVVYLGRETKNGAEMISFWSSNQHAGYGKKTVPLRAMHHLVFSRLTHPEALINSSALPKRDPYLASLLEQHSSSMEEVRQRCGID